MSKLDVFNFNYSSNLKTIDSERAIGKSIDNEPGERYFSSMSFSPNIFGFEEEIRDNLYDRRYSSITTGIDYRFLNDKVVGILADAYASGAIKGIRLLPAGKRLTKDIYDKFNNSSFTGMLLSVDAVAGNIDLDDSFVDLRNENGIVRIEKTEYMDGNNVIHNNDNIHIIRELNDEELQYVANLLAQNKYTNIIVDFYNPAYYKKLISALNALAIPSDVTIRFLANPLYDDIYLYDGLDNIIENPIVIFYNTCNDLNEFYQSEPYSEAVCYYSDIEASGKTDVVTYIKMINMMNDIVQHMKKMNYSPLEMVSYLYDYFKDHYVYNENFENEAHANNADLDKIFSKDNMICEGFSNLFSAILRRAGLLCFTYGTNDHQRNIIRLTDDKYGIDKIALIDPTWDIENRNSFDNFLLKMDSYLYSDSKEVINIPNGFFITQRDYDNNIERSNPVYSTSPMGYGVRMLELMGLSMKVDPRLSEGIIADKFRDALANSDLTGQIPAAKIASAVTYVRAREGEYNEPYEKRVDNSNVFANLSSRGFIGINPAISDFDNNIIPVTRHICHSNEKFDIVTPQNKLLNYPRKKYEFESSTAYDKYLDDFYHSRFVKNDNFIDVEEDLIYENENINSDADENYDDDFLANVDVFDNRDDAIAASDDEYDDSIDEEEFDNSQINENGIQYGIPVPVQNDDMISYDEENQNDISNDEDLQFEEENDSEDELIGANEIEEAIDESLESTNDNEFELPNYGDLQFEEENDSEDELTGANEIEEAIDESLENTNDNGFELPNYQDLQFEEENDSEDELIGANEIEEAIDDSLTNISDEQLGITDSKEDNLIGTEDIENVINDSLENVSDDVYTYTPMTDEEIEKARLNIEYDKYNEIYRRDLNDFIPGTDVLKPRDMYDDESEEEYDDYVDDYMNKHLPAGQPRELLPETIVSNSSEDDNNELGNSNNMVNIYVNNEGTIFYVDDETATRFNLQSPAFPARIENKLVYRISKEEAERLVNNRKNSINPYEVELKLFDRLYDRTDDEYLSFDNEGKTR